MEEIKILEDYIELIKKGYCEDCNELCNIYGTPTYPAKKISEAIENLINRNRGLEALKNSCPAIPTTGIECDLKKELEEDYTSVYLKGVYDERDKWKSKIKEKIEELREKGESNLRTYGFAVETHLANQVLEELL